jgi:hypothetical protein
MMDAAVRRPVNRVWRDWPKTPAEGLLPAPRHDEIVVCGPQGQLTYWGGARHGFDVDRIVVTTPPAAKPKEIAPAGLDVEATFAELSKHIQIILSTFNQRLGFAVMAKRQAEDRRRLELVETLVERIAEKELEGASYRELDPKAETVVESPELGWFTSHLAELMEQHPGQWIALRGSTVLAIRERLSDVVDVAAASGEAEPFITRIPTSPVTWFTALHAG